MSRYQPVLLGGLFIGVLSSLPIVGSANACCCLWVVVGGVLTVYLQQQSRGQPVEAAEAALSGLMAGAVGALINVLAVALLLSGSHASLTFDQQIRAALDQNAQVPPEARDRILALVNSRFLPAIMAVMTLPIYAIFGMLGALLGAAIFKKKSPPATPAG